MKTKARDRSQRGNVAVEAALTLTLFLTIMLSIFDIGWTLFVHQTLVHQARMGARYAAVNPTSLTAAQNLVLYNQTTAGTSGILGLQASNVSVTRNGTTGGSDDRINVTISGYQYILFVPGWAGAYTARSVNVTIPVEN